jgi:hypothetical protein
MGVLRRHEAMMNGRSEQPSPDGPASECHRHIEFCKTLVRF